MSSPSAYTQSYTQQGLTCLICGSHLTVRPAQGRKSKKPFIMLLCSRDARHFRAFINDQDYVRQVLERIETHS